MKRKLVTIMMTIALTTTLIACNDSNSEPITNSEFGMQNSELETEIDSEVESEETTEAESKETETKAETETEATKETESDTESTESKEDSTKKEENTTSSKKEDTSKNEDTSKKNEVKNDTSKKEDTSSKTEENNTNTSKNDTPKKEEVKKEEPKQEETPSKKEESNTNTSNNNNNTEASNNTPAPAPAPEPACTHPQTYISSGMHLRTESLGGGCVREIEAAEDICLTCGAVVRSYEREGQVGHAGYHVTGDSKAPTCTEDGYDYTTVTCDCGGSVNTNNSTYPAHGHAYDTWCTGEVSEDGMKAQYVTACLECGDVQAEWWE